MEEHRRAFRLTPSPPLRTSTSLSKRDCQIPTSSRRLRDRVRSTLYFRINIFARARASDRNLAKSCRYYAGPESRPFVRRDSPRVIDSIVLERTDANIRRHRRESHLLLRLEFLHSAVGQTFGARSRLMVDSPLLEHE